LSDCLSTTCIKLFFSVKKTKLNILLENSCADTYLPNRTYGKGPFQSRNDWKWDNLNRAIYIDKFQVTNRDIKEWMEYDLTAPNIIIPKQSTALSAPTSNLTVVQMQRYCAFQGKQLLQAHFFDAATFYLGRKRKSGILFRSQYPWTRKAKSSFLYKAQNDLEYSFNKKYCSKIYSKECLNTTFPFYNHSTNSSSWMGIYQVFGGMLEYFDNPINQKQNINASSYYFPLTSRWHQLGVRSYWDGMHHAQKNFRWTKFGPPNIRSTQLKVGFRCMRNVHYEN